MKTKSNIFSILAVLVYTTLASCSEGEPYSRFYHIENGKWYRDSLLVFSIDSLISAPGTKYAVTVELTTNRSYPYRNIWLHIDQDITGSAVHTDTVRYLLADKYGKWLGNGAGGLNQLSLPYRSFSLRDSVCNYRLVIRQAMNDDPLRGVEKVGIKIIEEEESKK